MKIYFKRPDIDVLIGLHMQETIDSISVSDDDYAYLYDEFSARKRISKEDQWWFVTDYGFSVHHDQFQKDYFTK